jgi:hypothetical protein
VVVCSILRGIECRAHCAGERVCVGKLAVVMRVEVSVAIAATQICREEVHHFVCGKENLQQLVCVFLCFGLLNSIFLL